jgi:hypothetical protein
MNFLRFTAALPVISAFWLTTGSLRVAAQDMGPAFLQGPTLAASLRNGVQAVSDQARLTARTAADMGQRAGGGGYQMQNFEADYQNLRLQFQNLRFTFAAAGELVVQSQSARAANATAELDAGLNIIAEAFLPVQQELQTGNVNRDTIVRMCQTLNQALDLWQKELKKSSARLGYIR